MDLQARWLRRIIDDRRAECTDVNADGTEIACDITPLARIDLGGGDDRFSSGADDDAVVVRAGPETTR